jgi:hypothetical protein
VGDYHRIYSSGIDRRPVGDRDVYFIYLCLIPVVEASEQTILQAVIHQNDRGAFSVLPKV